MEIPSESQHWVIAHDKAVLRLRRLIWFLAGACILGVVTGFNNYDVLAEKHRLVQEFISSKVNTELYRQQLIISYNLKRFESMQKSFATSKKIVESRTQTLDIKTVPGLDFAVENYIAKNIPTENFEIKGFKVGRLVVLPVMYGPILILGLIF